MATVEVDDGKLVYSLGVKVGWCHSLSLHSSYQPRQLNSICNIWTGAPLGVNPALSVAQTDGRTPERYVDPAARAVSIERKRRSVWFLRRHVHSTWTELNWTDMFSDFSPQTRLRRLQCCVSWNRAKCCTKCSTNCICRPINGPASGRRRRRQAAASSYLLYSRSQSFACNWVDWHKFEIAYLEVNVVLFKVLWNGF